MRYCSLPNPSADLCFTVASFTSIVSTYVKNARRVVFDMSDDAVSSEKVIISSAFSRSVAVTCCMEGRCSCMEESMVLKESSESMREKRVSGRRREAVDERMGKEVSIVRCGAHVRVADMYEYT